MDTAKVFMTGRSQAVRLPKAYRFAAGEVLIEKLADGSVVLRPKPVKGLGTRLREALGDEPMSTVERPEPLPLERDAAWWDAEIAAYEVETAPKRSTRKSPAAAE